MRSALCSYAGVVNVPVCDDNVHLLMYRQLLRANVYLTHSSCHFELTTRRVLRQGIYPCFQQLCGSTYGFNITEFRPILEGLFVSIGTGLFDVDALDLVWTHCMTPTGTRLMIETWFLSSRGDI
ncbi:hypothetical protein AVEN_180171-1 [Araneus ventricosus]|uniref:Uncharacterized protein n=1 Tax=Araneus ventricosus TaxID=182803 RepID=A0A4Y2K9J3_ARAVE|nr:hypothetical protein AVEN_180171-1 [Araneus ventricosus]